MRDASGVPITDWTVRPFEATRLHPLWIGAALAVVVAAFSTLGRVAVGAGPYVPVEDGRFVANAFLGIDLLNGVLLAYIPTARALLRRAAIRDLEALRPALPVDDARFDELVREVLCVRPLQLLVSGAVGGCFLGALPFVDPGFWEGARPAALDPVLLMVSARMFATGWFAGHAIAAESVATIGLLRIGAEEVEVDLLEPEVLHAFGRRGQRSASVWIFCSFLISLFWLGPGAGSVNAPMVLGIVALTLWQFLATVHGVHKRIRTAKQAALSGLRDQIRTEVGRLATPAQLGEPAEPADPRLANLVAYQGLVSRVPEWPFDAPVLTRIALIALLGLGSWLGAALVERVLDRALG